MKIVKTPISFASFLLVAVLFLNACRPIRNLKNPPSAWQGDSNFKSKTPDYSAAKKNVFIIADANMTELFDMLAPFYLFNTTQKANVYIVAKDKTPIFKEGLICKAAINF